MERRIHVSSCSTGDTTAPMIRLRGRWLAAVGFREGTKVLIAVHNGKLVLRTSDDEVREPRQ